MGAWRRWGRSALADLFVRRSADDYAEAFADLHPTGPAWPRDDDEALTEITRGLAAIWGQVDARAADLLFIETDPRLTLELLPDWERAFGLPDACSTEAQTLPVRRDALLRKLTTLNRVDRQFYIDLATALGYRIKIYEYRPVISGITVCGDTRPAGELTYQYARAGVAVCGIDPMCAISLSAGDDWVWRCAAPNIRFLWRISVLNTSLRWLRAGAGQCGVDNHCEFGLATDLECLVRRLKPGHTEVMFDYSQVTVNA